MVDHSKPRYYPFSGPQADAWPWAATSYPHQDGALLQNLSVEVGDSTIELATGIVNSLVQLEKVSETSGIVTVTWN